MIKKLFSRMRFRNIIIINIFIVYTIFMLLLFSIFHSFYFDTTKEKFKDENKITLKVIKDSIKTYTDLLGNETKLFSEDGIIHNAFYSDSYIYIKLGKSHREKLEPSFIVVEPINKLYFIKLANEIKFKLNAQLTVKSAKNVAFFSNNYEIKGYTSDFMKNYNKIYDEKFIKDEIGTERSSYGAGGISAIDYINGKFIMKGASKIGLQDARGAIMITQTLDGSILDEIKKNTGREIFLIKDNKIIDSTIFNGSERIENYNLQEKIENYSEIDVNGSKIGLSISPILNYNQKIIGYIGSGFDIKEMNEIYIQTIRMFLPYEIFFSILMMIIIYLIIVKLFKPFNIILNGIKAIKERKYNQKIEIETSGELKLLKDSLNDLAFTVKNREEELIELNKEIENTQRELLIALGTIGEFHSKETANHVKRVGEYSRVLANLYGLEEKEVELIRVAAPIHDIGKIGIPDAVLLKPGKLEPEEFEIIKTHAMTGYEMLRHSPRKILNTAAIIALQHHEKWDGTGYPQKLAGENIHIYGRIVAIADVFDALSSDRCYKKAWEMPKILELLQEQAGKHFDPLLVKLFLENIHIFIKIKEEYKDGFEEAKEIIAKLG